MVRLTERPDMTLDVYPTVDVKQQYNNNNNKSVKALTQRSRKEVVFSDN